MTSDAVSKLAERAGRDPALAKALAAAPTVSEAIRVAAEHGVTVTAEELAESAGQLSDADLAAASGGNLNQIWPTAPWVAC